MPLDAWVPHMCHVSNLIKNLTKDKDMDHFDVWKVALRILSVTKKN